MITLLDEEDSPWLSTVDRPSEWFRTYIPYQRAVLRAEAHQLSEDLRSGDPRRLIREEGTRHLLAVCWVMRDLRDQTGTRDDEDVQALFARLDDRKP